VGWVIVVGLLVVSASALLSDLQLHQTAVTSARIKAILRPSEVDQNPMRWRLLMLAEQAGQTGRRAPWSARPRLPRNPVARRPAWPDGRDQAEKPGPGGVQAGGEVERGSFAAGHPNLLGAPARPDRGCRRTGPAGCAWTLQLLTHPTAY
jgi:hypothetical protein